MQRRILIAEDSEQTRKQLKTLLEADGAYRVDTVGDGRAAEFLLLEQFSNGVNTYTRGNGSGTSRKNDTVGISGLQRSPQVRQPRSDVRCFIVEVVPRTSGILRGAHPNHAPVGLRVRVWHTRELRRLAIRAAKFEPEADCATWSVSETHYDGISVVEKNEGPLRGQIRTPLHSQLFLFNALAFECIRLPCPCRNACIPQRGIESASRIGQSLFCTTLFSL